jgi:hypothetical protein
VVVLVVLRLEMQEGLLVVQQLHQEQHQRFPIQAHLRLLQV